MDLFALLRAGVRSGDTPDIGGSTDDRWRELYTAASSQGVSALVWDGIRRLPPESQPSRELRLRSAGCTLFRNIGPAAIWIVSFAAITSAAIGWPNRSGPR